MHRKQVLLPVLALFLSAQWGQSADNSYEKTVHPIFEAKCIKCHGNEKRSGGLLLTSRHAALTLSDFGHVPIVPGKPAESEIINRITDNDPDKRMPKGADPLSPSEIESIRDWIAAGAPWEEAEKHWAYIKPQRPPLPQVTTNWVQNPIDNFIFAKLTEKGLQPSEAADRPRLLRRASLDLIGLPPPPSLLDKFLADESLDAFEKVVDELLKSPRFGEHWARLWLDLARYADSNGFQADQLRDSWAYRDWVINAFNSNMPYDQFTIEQIAGDLLPDATSDQRIATGFHRTPTCNVEAGVHPEENRFNQVVDRINTTGTVWLGTTLECAQCHNHKYDPFSMEDYYQIFAYFNNTPLEVKQQGNGVTWDFYGPTMDLPMLPGQQKRLDELNAKRADNETKLKALKTEAAQAQVVWETKALETLDNQPQWQAFDLLDFESTGGETHTVLEDKSVLIGGPQPENSTFNVSFKTQMKGITSIRLEALTHPSLPGNGPGRHKIAARPNFVLNEFKLQVKGADGKLTRCKLVDPRADFSQKGWNVSGLLDDNLKTGWAIHPQFGKPHWATFRTTEPVGDSDTVLIFEFVHNFGGSRTVGCFRLSGIAGEPGTHNIPDEIVKTLKQKPAERNELAKAKLAEHYLSSNSSLKSLEQEIQKIDQEIAGLKPRTTLVMIDMEKPRETHIMIRGDYLSMGKKVATGTPDILHRLNPNLPSNRLGLAKWLVDPENPLVARVAVNRWWAELMGQGIVRSVEDFGSQCEPPTHPQLLDWLAAEFVESGWSMKHILKLMVMSATYQQESKISAAQLEKDPKNLYYGRGPRFRMSAEMIRDNALAVSGLLCDKMYGPPIYPPQPGNIWRHVGRNGPKFNIQNDENRFRRGIYVVWRRGAPYVSFVNFDAPDRGACHPQRSRTNTPLQALTLLNDEAYVEMAMAFAGRILDEKPGDDISAQLNHAFKICFSRTPSLDEFSYLDTLYREQLKRYQTEPASADALLKGIKGWDPSKGLKKEQLAAWFHVTNILLNLDETITRS